MKQLQEILTKLLVKLPKNTLATLIVILGTILISHWYKDYKIDNDGLRIEINALRKDFQDYKRVSREEHRAIRKEMSDLDKRETNSEKKIEVIALRQDKNTRAVLNILNNNIRLPVIEEPVKEDSVVRPVYDDLQPIKNNHKGLVPNEITAALILSVDSTSKKRGFLGTILNIFK